MADDKPRLLIAVDIEASGASMTRHKVMSIGVFVAEFNDKKPDGYKEIDKRRFNFLIDYEHDFEPRCVEEFWSKYPEQLEACKIDAKDPKIMWREFADYIDSYEKKYKVKFLSDNPSFDIAWIDYAYDTILDRLPMRFTTDKKFRSVCNAGNVYETAVEVFLDKEKAESLTTYVYANSCNDHNPINDAHRIFLKYYKVRSMK